MPGKKRIDVRSTENEKAESSEPMTAGDPMADPPCGEAAEPLEESPEAQLEAARQEARENYDRFLRVSAEFDNYKKRSAREQEDFRKFANESLIRELLSVVDDLERAVASSGSEPESRVSIREGVAMTLENILKVLKNANVEPVTATGEPFDPRFHEAVMQEQSPAHPDNTVIREFQKGYLLHGRLLRPAMVVVSRSGGAGDGG